ncbi:ribonuclease E activity regulator RraA [Pseudarthrobacter sp. P1]|uniref:ribonuclease E activity regulator RraA n=1 Tax=Pseudarthrobacter sp. P1 TaxID=3418418 RepID=UPI003CF92668
MSIATADLYDQRGHELASVSLQLRSFGGVEAFDGPVRTVVCFQDNALAKSILSSPGNGAVLVIDGGGSLETALMGDMIAQLAIDNGWAGVVINGAIRDSVAIAALPLGVKALGTNPAKSTKTGAGEADVVVLLGTVAIRPGAHLWADADGILLET